MYPIKGKYSTAYIMTGETDIDTKAYEQILGFVNNHVFTNNSRIMPDYHYGNGACIGFTMHMTDKIIPNIVGVDINCNMQYVSFQKYLDFDKAQWLAVDRQVRKRIPMGFNYLKKPGLDMYRDFPWAIASASMNMLTSNINKHLGTEFRGKPYTDKYFFELCERVGCDPVRAVNSIGTLGSGNHFIEFSVSEKTGNTGVTVHAGSRNLGARVCNYWQNEAKQNRKQRYEVEFKHTIEEIKKTNPSSKWNDLIKAAKHPPTPTGLEYLDGEDLYGYLYDMHLCGVYAHKNVLDMTSVILELLNVPQRVLLSEDAVHTVHNFISTDLIIRKGAVPSYKGEKMLIPFNMEDGILICEGKSAEDWNCSAPHGPMKRDKSIVVDDIRKRMGDKGIYMSVIPKDEIKEAYKDPKFIEDALAPTATIVDRLKPVLPIKADD